MKRPAGYIVRLGGAKGEQRGVSSGPLGYIYGPEPYRRRRCVLCCPPMAAGGRAAERRGARDALTLTLAQEFKTLADVCKRIGCVDIPLVPCGKGRASVKKTCRQSEAASSFSVERTTRATWERGPSSFGVCPDNRPREAEGQQAGAPNVQAAGLARLVHVASPSPVPPCAGLCRAPTLYDRGDVEQTRPYSALRAAVFFILGQRVQLVRCRRASAKCSSWPTEPFACPSRMAQGTVLWRSHVARTLSDERELCSERIKGNRHEVWLEHTYVPGQSVR